MIRLRRDCLAFKSPEGDFIPCSAQQVVVELIGDAAKWLDKEVITHASEAVLHYFRTEKGQESVSFGEFVEALERVLKGLGLDIKATSASASLQPVTAKDWPHLPSSPPPKRRVFESDLQDLAGRSAGGAELFFFPLLRDEVHRRLDGSPKVLVFRGLRSCVKQIIGTKRWSPACQAMNDQIVEYLRSCLTLEKAGGDCSLVVL